MDVYGFLSVVGMVVGLAGLWWSSDKAVEFSIELSDLFGITKFFIGFVFMAVATGLPELAIGIASLWKGLPGVAVGTIIGSNLGDVSLVLGIPAVIFGTLNVKKRGQVPLNVSAYDYRTRYGDGFYRRKRYVLAWDLICYFVFWSHLVVVENEGGAHCSE